MVLDPRQGDPLHPTDFGLQMASGDEWPPRPWFDRLRERIADPLYGRHSRIVASVVYLGVLYFAWRSGWFVPFMAGSLATFAVLLVWAEAK